MTEMEAQMRSMSDMETGPDESWKTKTYLVGAVLGLLVGLGTAFLLVRSSNERTGGPPDVSTMDALKVGVALIGLIRGIASLGD